MRSIFLDHQSATPLLPEVRAAMAPFFAEAFGNPASLHQHGLRARDAVAEARTQVGTLLNAATPADEIIFTSGGTEAVNLAIKGAAWAAARRGNHIIASAIEHPAVLGALAFLEQHGFTCTRVRVDREGRIDPADVRAALTDRTVLICAHHANHDLGTIQPVAELGRIAAGHGAAFFVDAVASAGWLPVDVQAWGAGLVAVSPHRFYGPKGVGVLYRHRRVPLTSLLHGGDQEGGRRAGTENVPAIVGAGVAAERARSNLARRIAHTAELQQQLWDGLRANIPHLLFNGPEPGPHRISTSVNVSVEFVEGEGVALMCDVQGVACASGTSCVSKALKVSPVLAATGRTPAVARGTVLFSLGEENTPAEIDAALAVIRRVVEKLRGMSPAWEEFTRENAALIRPAGPRASAAKKDPKSVPRNR